MNSFDNLLIDLCVNALKQHQLINKDAIEKQRKIDAFRWFNHNGLTEVQERFLNENGTERFCELLDSAGIKYRKHPRGYLSHYEEVEGFLILNPNFDSNLIWGLRYFTMEQTIRMLDGMEEPYFLSTNSTIKHNYNPDLLSRYRPINKIIMSDKVLKALGIERPRDIIEDETQIYKKINGKWVGEDIWLIPRTNWISYMK